jgi:hypothetical protein
MHICYWNLYLITTIPEPPLPPNISWSLPPPPPPLLVVPAIAVTVPTDFLQFHLFHKDLQHLEFHFCLILHHLQHKIMNYLKLKLLYLFHQHHHPVLLGVAEPATVAPPPPPAAPGVPGEPIPPFVPCGGLVGGVFPVPPGL